MIVLTIGLLLLLPLARPTVSTSDEGAYGIQAELVAEGRWDYPPPLARFDPDGRYFPISRSEMVEGRWYPYVKHPLVPAAMAPLVAAFGRDAGVLALPLLGTVLATIAAWFLAAELDPRRTRVAFWLAAASPLLRRVHRLGPHRKGRAGRGRGRSRRCASPERSHPASVAGLTTTLVGGALVRSESVLFAGALLVATSLVLGRRRGLRAALAATAVPGAVVTVTLWAERRWVAAVMHGVAPADLVLRTGPDGPDDARDPSSWSDASRASGTRPCRARAPGAWGSDCSSPLALRGRRRPRRPPAPRPTRHPRERSSRWPR